MIALIQAGMDAVADAMSQMWQMPDWALDQQRQNDPEAILAYFHSVWPDLSHVPDQLRVTSLLMALPSFMRGLPSGTLSLLVP